MNITKEQLEAIFDARIDSIKRKLKSSGMIFNESGRGKTYSITIEDEKSIFIYTMMAHYGFDARTQWEQLHIFCQGYFQDERELALEFQKDTAEQLGVNVNTVGKWIANFEKAGVISTIAKAEQIEYVCVEKSAGVNCLDEKREVYAITKELYCEAWQAYFTAIRRGESISGAFAAMVGIADGRVYKLQAPATNGFYSQELFNVLALDINWN